MKPARRQSTGLTKRKNGRKKRSREKDIHFRAPFKTLFQLALVNRRVLVEYESCFRRERGTGPPPLPPPGSRNPRASLEKEPALFQERFVWLRSSQRTDYARVTRSTPGWFSFSRRRIASRRNFFCIASRGTSNPESSRAEAGLLTRCDNLNNATTAVE